MLKPLYTVISEPRHQLSAPTAGASVYDDRLAREKLASVGVLVTGYWDFVKFPNRAPLKIPPQSRTCAQQLFWLWLHEQLPIEVADLARLLDLKAQELNMRHRFRSPEWRSIVRFDGNGTGTVWLALGSYAELASRGANVEPVNPPA